MLEICDRRKVDAAAALLVRAVRQHLECVVYVFQHAVRIVFRPQVYAKHANPAPALSPS